MFNNLIESSSHAREFKRRGSFVLFTSAIYVTLFVIAGVASIYAYDARLDNQNTEIIVMLNPVDRPAPPVAVIHTAPPPRGGTSKPETVVRANDFVSINHPEMVPEKPSSNPNPGLPVPDHGKYILGDHDSGPVEPAGNEQPGTNVDGPAGDGRVPVVDVGTPPPQPQVERPVPRVVSKGVITGLALALPKPAYPQIAKQAGARGAVNVQVLIDEKGRVISAKAVSGNPMLMPAAQQAALGARFSPTMLGDQAVKVSGVIVYNFMLQ